MTNEIKLIDLIENEYNDCVLYQSFVSCKQLLEKQLLDEAAWDPKEKGPHYNKHVCAEDEKYTGEEDSSGRIKFPHMKYGKYLGDAERLADAPHCSKTKNDSGVFGWSSRFHKTPNIINMRFKKSNLKASDGSDLYEYVGYRPVYGDTTIDKTENGITFHYYKILDKIIFSYGLTRDPEYDFPMEREFGPNELTESLMRVTEELLTEANRQQLLQKSRKGRSYAPSNQYNGRNRFERRMKSSISATVRDYNMIQMDPLFKRDILEFKIPVMGETDVYVVDVRVDGLLAEIRKQLMANKGTLEFKVVLQSLMKVLNIGDVYIGCNCPDARYRQAYWQTSNDYKAGYKERRPSNITNPHDDLGAGCKHVLLILANLDWAVKVASVINNYIKYCKEHLQRNYADYIFPKIYGMKYDKAVQLNLFDNGLFPEDQKTMKAVIDQGFRGKDEKGKFAKGNEYRFQKKEPEPEEPEEENPLDLKFRNEEEPEEETPEEES